MANEPERATPLTPQEAEAIVKKAAENILAPTDPAIVKLWADGSKVGEVTHRKSMQTKDLKNKIFPQPDE